MLIVSNLAIDVDVLITATVERNPSEQWYLYAHVGASGWLEHVYVTPHDAPYSSSKLQTEVALPFGTSITIESVQLHEYVMENNKMLTRSLSLWHVYSYQHPSFNVVQVEPNDLKDESWKVDSFA
jgi:hypothetical protein